MALPIKIITKSDFTDIVEIANNIIDKKLNPQIVNAQEFDLCELMGDDFYYYFMSWFDTDGTIKDNAPQPIIDLYNGSYYSLSVNAPTGGIVDDEDDTFQFNASSVDRYNPGIKPVLVCYTAARLVRKVDAHITPNGYMDKTNEFSEHASGGRKAFDSNEYENQALAYWHKVLKFMEADKGLFPQYFTDCGCNTGNGKVKPRMIPIGNDDGYVNKTGYGRIYHRRR